MTYLYDFISDWSNVVIMELKENDLKNYKIFSWNNITNKDKYLYITDGLYLGIKSIISFASNNSHRCIF